MTSLFQQRRTDRFVGEISAASKRVIDNIPDDVLEACKPEDYKIFGSIPKAVVVALNNLLVSGQLSPIRSSRIKQMSRDIKLMRN